MANFSMLKSILREGEDGRIPLVWGKTEFHKDPRRVDNSYTEDEEKAVSGWKEPKEREPEEKEKKEGDVIDLDKKSAEGSSKKPGEKDAKKKEDPDRQGIIRKVDGAHLVYKKKNDSGTYDELWMFPYRNQFDKGTLKRGGAIKKAILAGTDIPVDNNASPDGSQKCKIEVLGDAEFILITGLQQ